MEFCIFKVKLVPVHAMLKDEIVLPGLAGTLQLTAVVASVKYCPFVENGTIGPGAEEEEYTLYSELIKKFPEPDNDVLNAQFPVPVVDCAIPYVE